MPQPFRFGSQIGPYDPFWVQVREAINQRTQQLCIGGQISNDILSSTVMVSLGEEIQTAIDHFDGDDGERLVECLCNSIGQSY